MWVVGIKEHFFSKTNRPKTDQKTDKKTDQKTDQNILVYEKVNDFTIFYCQ